ELGLCLEVLQKADEAPDVALVERRVDLVEYAERTRLHEVDAEEQGECRERTLAARQEVEALGPLPARGRVDVDGGLERIVGVLEPDVGLAALEEPQERLTEVLADLLEDPGEQVRRRLVDFADGGPKVVACLHEVVALPLEEREPL